MIDAHEVIQGSALGSDSHPASPRLLFFGYFSHSVEANRWRNRALWGVVVLVAGLALRFALMGHVPGMITDLVMTASIAGCVGVMNFMNWKYLASLDELHRQIALQGTAFSYYVTLTVVVTGCILVRYSLLGGMGLLWWTIGVKSLSQGIGWILAARKYQ